MDDSGRSATCPGNAPAHHTLAGGVAPGPSEALRADRRQPWHLLGSHEPRADRVFPHLVIGIVTHGALINPSWKHGPPWQLQTATILKQQGYDAVIPFNWVSESSKPGMRPGRACGWPGRSSRRRAGSPRLGRSTSTSSATARGPWSTPRRSWPWRSRCRRSSPPASSKTRCSTPTPPTTTFPARPAHGGQSAGRAGQGAGDQLPGSGQRPSGLHPSGG